MEAALLKTSWLADAGTDCAPVLSLLSAVVCSFDGYSAQLMLPAGTTFSAAKPRLLERSFMQHVLQ